MTGHVGPAQPEPGNSTSFPAHLPAILHSIYEATHRPDGWQTIMQATAPLFGTSTAILFEIDRICPSESRTDAIGLDTEFLERLRHRNLAEDALWQAMVRLPQGGVFRSTELMGIDERNAHHMYEQIGVPAGLQYLMGAILENTPAFFTDISFALADRDFTDGEKSLLTALVPHLQTALQISRRIALGDAGRREALLSFDRARQALVVLDRSGYAIYSNAPAQELLGAADGMALKFGRFIFSDITLHTEFERLLRLALATPESDAAPLPQEIRVPRHPAGSPYGLSILAVTRSADRALLPDGAACMVLIHDLTGLNPLPLDRLAWFYELTPAEARICGALYRVGSVDAAADELHLTRHTVRSHLKSIYSKFGVATQGQLMQRLANSVRLNEGGLEALRR